MGFTEFGPLLIAQDLVQDRFGTLSRAWDRDAKGDLQPIFLRRFAPSLDTPAVTEALQRSQGALVLPSACGFEHRFGLLPAPHWKVNHQKSRSIRRIQEKCREEGFPLDLSLSLHVAWTLAHVCAGFWRAGLSIGPMSLDTIRVDFEGGLFLPDLGWLPILIHLADQDPILRMALPELPHGPVEGDLGEEALRFGAFLYELITFEPLPAGRTPADAIEGARYWTPEGPRALPDALRRGLARLLGGGQPFETLEGALKDFEQLVFEDEDGPSTFNLAHLMHTLFRQDFARQREQLENEALALERSGSQGQGLVPTTQPPAAPSRSHRGLMAGGAAVLAGLGLAAFLVLRGHPGAATSPPDPPRAPDQVRPLAPAQVQAQPEPQVQAPTQGPAARIPVPAPPVPAARPSEPVEKPAPRPAPAPAIPAGTPDRPAQIQSLAKVAWPQGEARMPVVVRIFVHEDGHPLQAAVEPGSSAGPRSIQAATEAALKSRFRPAVRSGRPLRDWVEVQFNP